MNARSLALIALLGFAPLAAAAQTQSLTSTDTAIANVGINQFMEGSVQSGSSSDTQNLRTNPDVSVSAPFTAPRSCYVGDVSVGVANLWLGGAGVSTTKLDEGCEARADSANYYARAEIRAKYGMLDHAERLMDRGDARMRMMRADFEAVFLKEPEWREVWRP